MVIEFIFVLKPFLMSLFLLIWVKETPGMKWMPVDKRTSITGKLTNENDTISYSDEKFLIASAEHSLGEILFSQLSQQNSAMTEIRDLAKTIGSTHTNNLNKIKAFASKNLLIVPSVLNEQVNKTYKKLGNKTGPEFDKEYSDWLVNSYKENIALFEKTIMEEGDDGIKSWVLTALPELRTHLEQAIQCQKKCNKM